MNMDIDFEPILAELAGIPQDPVFHGEGDVLAHTRLVMDELERLPFFLSLDKAGRETMRLAAALHDLGKRTCTRIEDGRWISPNHSAAGAKMAREFLIGQSGLCGTPQALAQRETVCALIRWHMRPVHIGMDGVSGRLPREMASLGGLARGFTLELLAALSEADCLGRTADDVPRLLEAVELFKMAAEDERCLRGPRTYPDAYSRYADLTGKSSCPDVPAYNNAWGTVVMMSGFPGTGKDTYIAHNYPGLPMLSLDEIRRELGVASGEDEGTVARTARERAREHLRQKKPFVFNATNLSSAVRNRWIGLFHQYGASVLIVYLETDWQERERRNLSRADSVPEAAVARMLRDFTPPTFSEAEEVEWICV